MLLFRPTLARYCTAREVATEDQLISLNDSFPRRVALQCSIICVKVAQEVIELIFNNTPSDGSTGSLPAWWYNILCETSFLSPIYITILTTFKRRLHSCYGLDCRSPPSSHLVRGNRVCNHKIMELCAWNTPEIPRLQHFRKTLRCRSGNTIRKSRIGRPSFPDTTKWPAGSEYTSDVSFKRSQRHVAWGRDERCCLR